MRRRARLCPPCRRFTILDAMILVAGAAVGIVGAWDRLIGFEGHSDYLPAARALAAIALMLASCLVLAFRLRGPRPRLWRVARQPGAVACLAAVGYLIADDADWVVRAAIERRLDDVGPVGEWIWLLLEEPAREVAHTVPICWAILLLGRRWRPEPGWIDRAGRVIGWGWIFWAIADGFLPG